MNFLTELFFTGSVSYRNKSKSPVTSTTFIAKKLYGPTEIMYGYKSQVRNPFIREMAASCPNSDIVHKNANIQLCMLV